MGTFHPSYPDLVPDWSIRRITSEVERPSYLHFPDCAAGKGGIRLQAASDRFRATTCSSHALSEIAVHQLALVGSSRLIHPHGCIHLSQLFKPRRSLPLAHSCRFAYSRRSLDRAHFEDKPTYTYTHYYLVCSINVIANMVTISKFASRLVSPISNPTPRTHHYATSQPLSTHSPLPTSTSDPS